MAGHHVWGEYLSGALSDTLHRRGVQLMLESKLCDKSLPGPTIVGHTTQRMP
jgi:hypothetical protein